MSKVREEKKETKVIKSKKRAKRNKSEKFPDTAAASRRAGNLISVRNPLRPQMWSAWLFNLICLACYADDDDADDDADD